MTTLLKIPISEKDGEVSALFNKPENAKYLLVLGHGAVIDMNHYFMETLAEELALQDIATLRFRFLYMEQGKRKTDTQNIAEMVIYQAIECANSLADGLPIFAGGKSYGGRMTSWLASSTELPTVKGLIYYGFPLHLTKSPGTERADHLVKVSHPMLFLQGTHDTEALMPLITKVCSALPTATLEFFQGCNHSFHNVESKDISQQEMIRQLAEKTREWMNELIHV